MVEPARIQCCLREEARQEWCSLLPALADSTLLVSECPLEGGRGPLAPCSPDIVSCPGLLLLGHSEHLGPRRMALGEWVEGGIYRPGSDGRFLVLPATQGRRLTLKAGHHTHGASQQASWKLAPSWHTWARDTSPPNAQCT